jgi:Short C-terminal domain/Phospholipase_D-nuclease N-terminal
MLARHKRARGGPADRTFSGGAQREPRPKEGPQMILATSYPLLEIFWTILVFFAFVVWLMILFTVLGDIFRRHDTTGLAKVLWIVAIVVLPYIGTFVYLITQHNGMVERGIRQQKAAQHEFDRYVQSVAAKADPTEQIHKAKELLDRGAINEAEFEQIKRQALAGASAPNA